MDYVLFFDADPAAASFGAFVWSLKRSSEHNTHNVSLGTDSPYQSTTQHFFLSPPGTEEHNKCPTQKKSPDKSNVLHMFNKNPYIDFRTAYIHLSIPSYII